MGSAASIIEVPNGVCVEGEDDNVEKVLQGIYGDLTEAGKDTPLSLGDVHKFFSTTPTFSTTDQLDSNKLFASLQMQIPTDTSEHTKQLSFADFRLWLLSKLQSLPHIEAISQLTSLSTIVKAYSVQVKQQVRELEAVKLRSRVEGPPKYPMYVMAVSDLLTSFKAALARESIDGFDGLPKHEDAMQDGRLYEVVERSGWPGQYFVYNTLPSGQRGEPVKYPLVDGVVYETEEKVFNRARFLSISHQWLRPSRNPMEAHPDSVDRIKCKALTQYLSLPASEDAYNFVWMDYFSIPQLPSRRDLQCLAIASLPTYFIYSTCTLILCKDMEGFQREQLGYLSRGHCLMELLTSKLPRIDVFNKWYISGISPDGSWGHTTVYSMSDQTTKVLMWQDFIDSGSPLQGNFTVEEDRLLMKPLIEEYIEVFRRFDMDYVHHIREAKTWQEVQDLPDELKPQLLGIPLRKSKKSIYTDHYAHIKEPIDLANYLLPKDYVQMLEESLQLI